MVRAEGLAEREWVELDHGDASREEVVLDPRVRTHDWNMLNNRKRVGGLLDRSCSAPSPAAEVYFHPYFSTRSRRDRLTVGLQPTVWYNDAGGCTLGLRSRERLLRTVRAEPGLDQREHRLGRGQRRARLGLLVFRVRNPVSLRRPTCPRRSTSSTSRGVTARTASCEWARRAHLTLRSDLDPSLELQWVATG